MAFGNWLVFSIQYIHNSMVKNAIDCWYVDAGINFDWLNQSCDMIACDLYHVSQLLVNLHHYYLSGVKQGYWQDVIRLF